MAHAATISSLVGGLVSSITRLDQKDESVNSLRENTIKSLKAQGSVRVNQFAVKERLDGLVEKFAVLNRDDLSDALQARLRDIPFQSKWIPDVLFLLLELSDRPVEKSKIEDLEHLTKAQSLATRELTWKDIIADDPLNEPGVWDNIERDYHSSGDEDYDEGDSEPTVSTQASSLLEEDAIASARLLLVDVSEEVLDPLRKAAQIWRLPKRRTDSTILSELVVIREVITMLHGLSTNLFTMSGTFNEVHVGRKVALDSTSSDAISSILQECVATGSALNFLRYWTSGPQPVTFQQSMQSEVQAQLTSLSSQLSKFEETFISPQQDTVVSLLSILEDLKVLTWPLKHISTLFQQCLTETFALIDLLYEQCCITQITDDKSAHTAISRIFFAGLHTYLRSLGVWIETGSVAGKDKDTFFVNDTGANCELSKFWHDRFTLRQLENGDAFVPKCMQHLAGKIFALGKSRAFLCRLRQSSDDLVTGASATLPASLISGLQQQDMSSLISFEQMLSDTLLAFITASSADCTPHLCTTLLRDHGLTDTLQAIPFIFFSKDSSLLLSFGESLLERLKVKPGDAAWNNSFILTELAHNSFGSLSLVAVENIYVSTRIEDSSSPRAKSSINRLTSLIVEYSLGPAVQNITLTPSPATHAQVLVLLLQVTFATHFLASSTFFSLRQQLQQPSPQASAATNAIDSAVSPEINPRVLKLRHSLRVFLHLFHQHLVLTTAAVHAQLTAALQAAPDVDAMVEVWRAHDTALARATLVEPKLAPLRDAVTGILETCEDLGAGSAALASSEGAGAYVRAAEQKLDQALRFLVPGLRSLGRSGAAPELERFAERLEVDMRLQQL